MVRSRVGWCISAIVSVLTVGGNTSAQIVQWDAEGPGISWGTPTNWAGDVIPGPTDIAVFTDAGASPSPSFVTNILDSSRTVGGLVFANQPFNYHRTDLAGNTLTVDGPFDFNVSTSTSTYATMSNGNLVVGTTTRQDFNVGWNFLSLAANATFNAAPATSMTGFLDQMRVGYSSGNQVATARLDLPPSANIDANNITVGWSENVNGGGAELHLGTNTTVLADTVLVGGRFSSGSLTAPSGGSLSVGSVARPCELTIGRNDRATNSGYTSTLDASGTTFNAVLRSLVVADGSGGGGSGALVGSLLGGNSGAITIGATTDRGQLVVGRNGSANVDLAGMSSMTAFVNDLLVGYADFASANGQLRLPKTNSIDAQTIVIGFSNGNDLGVSRMTLGAMNTVQANQLLVGNRRAPGQLIMPVGGTLNLGSLANRVDLRVGVNDIPTNNGTTSLFDARGGTWNAYLSNVTVAERSGGGFGLTTGTILGGSAGAVVIGSVASPGALYVGRSIDGSPSAGVMDLGSMDSVTANLGTLAVGVSYFGRAQGVLTLAANNTITADSIVLGSSVFTDDSNGGMVLGTTNNFATPRMVVGGDRSNGSVSFATSGTFALGSAGARSDLFIGQNNASAASSTGIMNLANGVFTGFLDDLVIGEKANGGEPTVGILTTGPSSTIDANRVQISVGYGNGTLNFNGGTMSASVSTINRGTVNLSNTVTINGFFDNTATGLVVNNNSATFQNNLRNNGVVQTLAGAVTTVNGFANGTGSYTGVGTVVFNGGFSPGNSPGHVTLDSNMVLGDAATLDIEIGGLAPGSEYDVVTINGHASLDGTLAIHLLDGFVPSVGDSFTIMDFASSDGSFDQITGLNIANGLQFDVAISGGDLLLTVVVPEPGGIVLGAIAVALFVIGQARHRYPSRRRSLTN